VSSADLILAGSGSRYPRSCASCYSSFFVSIDPNTSPSPAPIAI